MIVKATVSTNTNINNYRIQIKSATQAQICNHLMYLIVELTSILCFCLASQIAFCRKNSTFCQNQKQRNCYYVRIHHTPSFSVGHVRMVKKWCMCGIKIVYGNDQQSKLINTHNSNTYIVLTTQSGIKCDRVAIEDNFEWSNIVATCINFQPQVLKSASISIHA